jgi:hypothetical protein
MQARPNINKFQITSVQTIKSNKILLECHFLFMPTLSGMQLGHKTTAGCTLLSVFCFCVGWFCSLLFLVFYLHSAVVSYASVLDDIFGYHLVVIVLLSHNSSFTKTESNYRAMIVHTIQHKGLKSNCIA